MEPRPQSFPGGCWELSPSDFSAVPETISAGAVPRPPPLHSITFTGSVRPEHAGPTVGLLFLSDSLDLVCPGPGVLVTEAWLATG